jgi:DNA polymerase IV
MASTPPPSSPTLRGSSPPVEELELSFLPPIFVLSAHLSTEDLHDIEDQLQDHGAVVTYDINEAKLVIGKVGTKKRAQFELRSRGLWTEEVVVAPVKASELDEEPPKKRARLNSPKTVSKPPPNIVSIGDSSTESEDESQKHKSPRKVEISPAVNRSNQETTTTSNNSSTESEVEVHTDNRARPSTGTESTSNNGALQKTPPRKVDSLKNVRVLKLQWLEDSFVQKRVLAVDPYIVYEGYTSQSPPGSGGSARKQSSFPIPTAKLSPKSQHNLAERPHIQTILERAQGDTSGSSQVAHYGPVSHGARRFGNRGASSEFSHKDPSQRPAKLLEMSTSEYDGSDSDMPKAPEWVRKNLRYSCQRSTPDHPPNEAFIETLKKIKLARLLVGDEIGVRAYSTCVAAVAAYPYVINNPREVLRLPGCDVKLANLWIEWKNFGHVKEAEDNENDETLKGLKLFYDIWGVGATTARTFYNEKGWRDTDDIVEYGWKDLNRVQQIGLKYYDEFKLGIPRAEVESIAAKVREHAVKVRDEGIELMVVGGYRRGKAESGDVDMIVSHRDLERTAGLINDIVASLEAEGWITHTLTLSLTSTERGQSTLPFKSVGVASHGVGFDTLDKALVVWQNPIWPNMDLDLAEDSQAKNPNVHRRVDIIISPWRTVGCAITGWSGGTTFQRDIRRYARATRGWKFDSSGVRNRSTGEVVELEGPEGVPGDMLDAEKAVFEGLGLVYRPPTERCTG